MSLFTLFGTIVILFLVGKALFEQGGKLGSETEKLKAEVAAFEKKHSVNVVWRAHSPKAYDEMCWIAYPQSNWIRYEIYHHRDRQLKELTNMLEAEGKPYAFSFFQFSDIEHFENADEVRQFNTAKHK